MITVNQHGSGIKECHVENLVKKKQSAMRISVWLSICSVIITGAGIPLLLPYLQLGAW